VADASGARGRQLFDLAGSFYFPASGVLFRSLVPAHGTFSQTINAGQLTESTFNPNSMMR